MTSKKLQLSPDVVRNGTSLKLDLINASTVDDRLSAGASRFFTRVMQQVDIATWTATLSDDRICAEVPGCKSRHTCNDHRKAIQEAGYFEFDSGSGRHPTRYLIAEAIPDAVKVRLAEKRHAYELEKAAERAIRDVVRPPRKALLRGGAQPSDTVVPRPPVHLRESPYQNARRLQDETPGVHTHETGVCECGKPAIWMIRQRPTAARPNGTPWEFQCLECVEDDDRVPGPEHQFWETRMIDVEPVQFGTTMEAYLKAKDGC